MGKQQNTLAKYNLKANRKINGWTLSKKLGSGGNGEVWMCKNDKKEEYAIKFFKFGRYGAAYERFVDEVLFMEQHQGIHGVLPIIDKNLPSKNKKNVDANIPIYYVMPLAESVEQKIKKFTLDEKVEVNLNNSNPFDYSTLSAILTKEPWEYLKHDIITEED